MIFGLVRKNERDYYGSIVFASAARKTDIINDINDNLFLVFDERKEKLIWVSEHYINDFSTIIGEKHEGYRKKQLIKIYTEENYSNIKWKTEMELVKKPWDYNPMESINTLDFLWDYFFENEHKTIEDLQVLVDKMPNGLKNESKKIADDYPCPEWFMMPEEDSNIGYDTLNFAYAVIDQVNCEDDYIKVLLTGMYDCDIEMCFKGNANASKTALSKNQKPWRSGGIFTENGTTYLVNNVEVNSVEKISKSAKVFSGNECIFRIIPFQR